MNKENILFIVEGESREINIVDNIRNVFFCKSQIKIIPIPAGKNIYMLWKQLSDDNYETDILEVLKEDLLIDTRDIEGMERDDFSEVYLFFDYDGHQNNISGEILPESILAAMLSTFNNETENGKLYISYPMVEALRDIIIGECGSTNGCVISHESVGDYKFLSSKSEAIKNQSKYNIEDWREIINVFALKLSCLAGRVDVLEYEEYKKSITPEYVYSLEKTLIEQNKVFVLSAFPQFLLDYNRFPFWNNMIKRTKTLKGSGCCV